jgi:foldase protein PrsA
MTLEMVAQGETVGRLVRRSRLPALALVMLSAALTGCGGGGVPASAVATVDGEPIERQSFDHWLEVMAKSSGRSAAAVPKPPGFAACVEQKQGAEPKAGQAALKNQCEAEYETLRTQVLQLLVTARWIEGEATDRGISVDDSDVEKAFEQQKKLSFPKETDFEKWLKSSGQTSQDVLMRVRFDLLSNKIREHVTKDENAVTEAEITAYFRENKQRFFRPERRDLRLVQTKTRADAEAAIADLEAGRSWSAVARKYSIDEATTADGGKLEDVVKGQHEKALDEAIFNAPKALVRGPVKTKLGYHVFAVTNVQAPSRQTFEQAKPTIEQLVAAESQQNALEGFIESFRAKWRERTECREGFMTPDCSNGPEPTATPAQAPTDAQRG